MSVSHLTSMQGKRVLQVFPEDAKTRIVLSDGLVFDFVLHGDCCSSSYYTSKDQWRELEGRVIMDIDDRSGRSGTGTEASGDHLTWHFMVFTTDEGHITIDWHNDSNGYYDGWVEVEPA